MLKHSKSLKILLSFLFLFSLVFFIASESHYNADCGSFCGCQDLTIMNNTQSALKITLSSSETEVVSVASNSKISFNIKRGTYKWIAYDKNTNKIISSGVINLEGDSKKNIINLRE